jgi:hypothetical protein
VTEFFGILLSELTDQLRQEHLPSTPFPFRAGFNLMPPTPPFMNYAQILPLDSGL